jgi:metal-responsive CopG/Arc/MetJ family transcriptional regulator
MAKVVISLPDAFLKKVDRLAAAQNPSRSELIREALRTILGSEHRVARSWKKSLAPLRALEQQWLS